MAKRKKSKGTKRRRRVGAVNSSLIMKAGSVVAGYFLGDTVNNTIDSFVKGKVSDTIVAGGQVGLGGLLLLSKRPNMIKTIAGGVAAGAGLKRLLSKSAAPAVTTGYGSVPVIAGYGKVPVLGSYNTGGTLGAYTPGGTVGRRRSSRLLN